jgi:glutaredoxin
MAVNHVAGKDVGPTMLYALSTCVWCGKTKKLLNDLGIAYDYVDVDLLAGDERKEVMKTVKEYNLAASFPTLVVGDSKCIVGFKENEIRESLKL